MSEPLCRECVTLEPLPNTLCCDCDDLPAAYYISVDLGFESGVPIGEGRYCKECGDEQLSRIREQLPEAEHSR